MKPATLYSLTEYEYTGLLRLRNLTKEHHIEYTKRLTYLERNRNRTGDLTEFYLNARQALRPKAKLGIR